MLISIQQTLIHFEVLLFYTAAPVQEPAQGFSQDSNHNKNETLTINIWSLLLQNHHVGYQYLSLLH